MSYLWQQDAAVTQSGSVETLYLLKVQTHPKRTYAINQTVRKDIHFVWIFTVKHNIICAI